ncbi:MAG TPA: hypothetical protein VF756_06120 [Thermoanaerobaculia bacterium]
MSRKDFASDPLRTTLRRGDPAAGEAGLAPEEVQAMRRTVLSAIPETRRPWLAPLLATAAGVALTILVALVIWRAFQIPSLPAPAIAEATPAAPPIPEISEAPLGQTEPEVSIQEPVKPRRPAAVIARRAPVPLPSAPDRPITEEPEVSPTRQVQFETPGGTRVIWVLAEGTGE